MTRHSRKFNSRKYNESARTPAICSYFSGLCSSDNRLAIALIQISLYRFNTVTMSKGKGHGIYKFLKPLRVTDLPELDKVVSASMAASVRKEVVSVLEEQTSTGHKHRQEYNKVSSEDKAFIAKYAAENGVTAAIRHFKKVDQYSAIDWMENAYVKELSARKRQNNDEPISELPSKTTGCPLLLGSSIEESSKAIVRTIRDNGGIVNSSVTIGIIKGVIHDVDSNLLLENGGQVDVNKEVARRLLGRMNFVKRKGTTKSKVTPENFKTMQTQFLEDIRTVVHFEEIPPELILNWDHTGIHYVPVSSWTLELKGAQKVPIAGADDKCQITAVFACSLSGEFLPPQLIYSGKTTACLPKIPFPANWHITHTINHWANEDTMHEYVKKILLPYLQAKRTHLALSHDFPALVIFYCFKGQITKDFLDFLEKNNILVVEVPPNCTDRLQPLDLSVNKPIKGFLRRRFQTWYADEIVKQLQKGTDVSKIQPADMCMSTVKPLGAKWIIEAFDYIKNEPSIIKNGFKEADIIKASENL